VGRPLQAAVVIFREAQIYKLTFNVVVGMATLYIFNIENQLLNWPDIIIRSISLDREAQRNILT
jgi:hypothetical protein